MGRSPGKGIKMTVQCEEVDYCKVKVKYVADPSLVEEKKNEAVRLLKKSNVQLPGFRMGQATDLAIRVHMKKQIDQMVTRELVSDAFTETLFETKMKPIGYPDVHSTRLDGRHFECEMTFAKKPEFELQQYTGFEIPKPHLEMTAAEGAEKLLQELRTVHGDVVTYGADDFVQEGDKITMDIHCFLDDKEIEIEIA